MKAIMKSGCEVTIPNYPVLFDHPESKSHSTLHTMELRRGCEIKAHQNRTFERWKRSKELEKLWTAALIYFSIMKGCK